MNKKRFHHIWDHSSVKSDLARLLLESRPVREVIDRKELDGTKIWHSMFSGLAWAQVDLRC